MAWDWVSELPVEVATDVGVRLPHRVGALAELGRALHEAGVDVQGGLSVVHGGVGVVHLLVSSPADSERASQAIDAAGFAVPSVREVLVAHVGGEPGGLVGWAITQRLAESGVNVELFYVATRLRLVYGVDDLPRAQQLLS